MIIQPLEKANSASEKHISKIGESKLEVEQIVKQKIIEMAEGL